MKRQIYRKEALERMGSPEQLDQLMTVTGPRGWIALAGMGLLLLIAILWSVLGHVTTTVEGDGVLIRLGGVKPVPAPAAGAVTAVQVQVGDTVRQGAELVRLIPPGAVGPEEALPVTSPADGRVLDIAVFEGDIVLEQAILVTIESSRAPLEAVVYVPAADGYRVHNGQDVRIVPATAAEGSASHLRGRVRVAGKFPASQAGMMRSVQNAEWVGSLLALGPQLEVVAEPGEGGWPSHLYSGTPCRAHITVDRQRPIQFVLPILNRRRGD